MEALCGVSQAYFRAAKAAVALENHEAAIRYCRKGLEHDEHNQELQQIAKKSQNKVAEHGARLKLAEDKRAGAEVRRIRPPQEMQETHNLIDAMSLPHVQALADALAARHVAVGPVEYSSHIGGRKAQLDSEGILHWPCLMIYPQPMAVDVVEDFCESDRFEDHLDQISFHSHAARWRTLGLILFLLFLGSFTSMRCTCSEKGPLPWSGMSRLPTNGRLWSSTTRWAEALHHHLLLVLGISQVGWGADPCSGSTFQKAAGGVSAYG